MPEHKESRRMTRRFKILTVTGATAVVAVLVVVGTVTAQTGQRFDDVPTDHYAFDAANWAADNGITQGCGDGTNFCPERTLNRANMVTFLKRYHDRFGTGITVAWSEPVDASGGVTLTGSGSDIAGPLTLTEGRWRVAFTVEPGAQPAHVAVTAFGDEPGWELLVNAIVDASAYSKTTQFRVGNDLFDDLAPGNIWFEVTANPDMMWTITAAPL